MCVLVWFECQQSKHYGRWSLELQYCIARINCALQSVLSGSQTWDLSVQISEHSLCCVC